MCVLRVGGGGGGVNPKGSLLTFRIRRANNQCLVMQGSHGDWKTWKDNMEKS